MWHWALEWSRTRKARRAVVAAISPIVEDSSHRLGGISDVAWSDPYIIGFMGNADQHHCKNTKRQDIRRLAVPRSVPRMGRYYCDAVGT